MSWLCHYVRWDVVCYVYLLRICFFLFGVLFASYMTWQSEGWVVRQLMSPVFLLAIWGWWSSYPWWPWLKIFPPERYEPNPENHTYYLGCSNDGSHESVKNPKFFAATHVSFGTFPLWCDSSKIFWPCLSLVCCLVIWFCWGWLLLSRVLFYGTLW